MSNLQIEALLTGVNQNLGLINKTVESVAQDVVFTNSLLRTLTEKVESQNQLLERLLEARSPNQSPS